MMLIFMELIMISWHPTPCIYWLEYPFFQLQFFFISMRFFQQRLSVLRMFLLKIILITQLQLDMKERGKRLIELGIGYGA